MNTISLARGGIEERSTRGEKRGEGKGWSGRRSVSLFHLVEKILSLKGVGNVGRYLVIIGKGNVFHGEVKHDNEQHGPPSPFSPSIKKKTLAFGKCKAVMKHVENLSISS